MDKPAARATFQNLRTPAGLYWLREPRGIVILASPTGQPVLLTGFAAELWEWLTTCTWAQVIELSAAYLRLAPEMTEARVVQALSEWLRAGWIIYCEEDR